MDLLPHKAIVAKDTPLPGEIFVRNTIRLQSVNKRFKIKQIKPVVERLRFFLLIRVIVVRIVIITSMVSGVC
jgi:hypothetical protein